MFKEKEFDYKSYVGSIKGQDIIDLGIQVLNECKEYEEQVNVIYNFITNISEDYKLTEQDRIDLEDILQDYVREREVK